MPMNRAPIIRPGGPITGADTGDPYSFQYGAVRTLLASGITGPSAIAPSAPLPHLINFTQGVVSFWGRIPNGASPSGDSAKVSLVGSIGGQPSLIVGNSVVGTGSIGVFLGPSSVDLYLVDFVANSEIAHVGISYGSPPPTGWHHYICSFDVGTLTTNISYSPLHFGGNIGGHSTWSQLLSRFQLPYYVSATVSQEQCQANHNFLLVNSPGSVANGFAFGTINIHGLNAAGIQAAEDAFVAANSPGNDIYIALFDTASTISVIRAQMAIDGAGGPLGGALMDTASDGTQPFLSQPFIINDAQNGLTGNLGVSDTDRWIIVAPSDTLADFAYCYCGVSATGEGFYDLTNLGNMRRFLTATGTPANLGRGGSNIPLECVFMHTGDMTAFSGAPFFPINAAQPYVATHPNDPILPGFQLQAWRTIPLVVSTDGPSLGT